eukprot:TRINITY_DN487_c0_g1_i1.p1 TRINITY_DN487_c0_g1~~TRINITY_DN487_c0_g1_i1.p1  ORF type:complete len:201 (+),score=23.24 TRINITY_DN487_c0_g1_i1:82-684(+)
MSVKVEPEVKIQELIAQGSWNQVAAFCEELEFELSNQPGTKIPFYNVQLLTYLIQGELDYARFLWRRIPNEVKSSSPELAEAWLIGKHMWTKNYTGIYQAINSFKGSPLSCTLVEIFSDIFRTKTLSLLSNAYTYLSVPEASKFLGLEHDDVVKYCTSRGWELDGDSKMFIPHPILEKKVQTAGLAHLQSLTEYVVYLEQ